MEMEGLQRFDPSTFTMIGRNDLAVSSALIHRSEQGLSMPKTVVLLGSGIIEPFTLAAQPLMRGAQVIAVDASEIVTGAGSFIKNGGAIPWQLMDVFARNPGRPNTDMLDITRIRHGISILKSVGSFEALGPNFDDERMAVSPEVRDRVTFVNSGALEAFDGALAGMRPDMIGSFFTLVNINKNPNSEFGIDYSRKLVDTSLNRLAPGGFLILGDTSANLPTTYHQLHASTNGSINYSGMVHAVNFGTGFTSSHNIVASQMESYPRIDLIEEGTRKNIETNPVFQNMGYNIGGDVVSPEGLAPRAEAMLNLAYVRALRGISWDSSLPTVEALRKLVPDPRSEMSEPTSFPAQKPHLSRG